MYRYSNFLVFLISFFYLFVYIYYLHFSRFKTEFLKLSIIIYSNHIRNKTKIQCVHGYPNGNFKKYIYKLLFNIYFKLNQILICIYLFSYNQSLY